MINREEKWLRYLWEWEQWPIYEWLTWEDAIAFLLEKQEWEVLKAFKCWKNKLDIDLIWWNYNQKTKQGIWLAKISQKHPSVLAKWLASLVETLSQRLPKSQAEAHKQIVLEDENFIVVIRLDWLWTPKKRLMTAYEKDWR